MIDYQTFHQIRQLCDQEHLSVTQIAAALQLDERTVNKWIDCQTSPRATAIDSLPSASRPPCSTAALTSASCAVASPNCTTHAPQHPPHWRLTSPNSKQPWTLTSLKRWPLETCSAYKQF